MPTPAVTTPPDNDPAPFNSASTAWLPSGPSSVLNWFDKAVVTFWVPKKRPAMLTTISSSGPSEKTE